MAPMARLTRFNGGIGWHRKLMSQTLLRNFPQANQPAIASD